MKQLTTKGIKKLFGDFKWREGLKGRIIITDDWEKKYIVRVELPIVGHVQCHKEVMFDLFRIFHYLEVNGDAQYIDTQDFRIRGGCYVPRHKCWDKRRGLSRHSWGVAIDLNVSTNSYGTKGDMHPHIIDMFAKYKYLWGGYWRIPDSMHFEPSNRWTPFLPVEKIDR
jgi:hypothetical protein